jgi:hypothetical protein
MDDPLASQAFVYSAYGLTLSSPVPLPFFPTASGTPNVEITFKKFCIPQAFNVEENSFYEDHEGIYLFWNAIGSFFVKESKQIFIHTAVPVNEGLLRLYLLGPVLAVLLHQRGRLVLHASAVEMSSACVLFLGQSGSGKSTMAAASSMRGHHVLNDDVSAIEVSQTESILLPGHSRIRLCHDTALHILKCREALPPLDALGEKYDYAVPSPRMDVQLPLSRAYVLADGESVEIQQLSTQESFRELVQHSYCNQLLPPPRRVKHFFQCARLAATMPVCRLKRPRSLIRLNQVFEVIEADQACSPSFRPTFA